MNTPTIQLLVLAGIAIFLIIKLRGVLGTREGFEKPHEEETAQPRRPALEVIEGGGDPDITDHVPQDSTAAKALAAMKRQEPGFGVGDFLLGARGAYEMILMAFEKGDMATLKPYLSPEVFDSFSQVVQDRKAKGLTIDAHFIGLRELSLKDATYDEKTHEGEITVKFVAEQTSVVRDKDGKIVEGKSDEVKRQRDVWTFARKMGSNDPNWKLVATDG